MRASILGIMGACLLLPACPEPSTSEDAGVPPGDSGTPTDAPIEPGTDAALDAGERPDSGPPAGSCDIAPVLAFGEKTPIAISADGRYLAVGAAREARGQLLVHDLVAGTSVVVSTEYGGEPTTIGDGTPTLQFSPDGRWVLWRNGPNLNAHAADGTGDTVWIEGVDVWRWHPDGQRLLILNPGELRIQPIEAARSTPLITGTGLSEGEASAPRSFMARAPRTIALTPDQTRAVVSEGAPNVRVRVVRLDGSGEVVVPDVGGFLQSSVTDGQLLARSPTTAGAPLAALHDIATGAMIRPVIPDGRSLTSDILVTQHHAFYVHGFTNLVRVSLETGASEDLGADSNPDLRAHWPTDRVFAWTDPSGRDSDAILAHAPGAAPVRLLGRSGFNPVLEDTLFDADMTRMYTRFDAELREITTADGTSRAIDTGEVDLEPGMMLLSELGHVIYVVRGDPDLLRAAPVGAGDPVTLATDPDFHELALLPGRRQMIYTIDDDDGGEPAHRIVCVDLP